MKLSLMEVTVNPLQLRMNKTRSEVQKQGYMDKTISNMVAYGIIERELC